MEYYYTWKKIMRLGRKHRTRLAEIDDSVVSEAARGGPAPTPHQVSERRAFGSRFAAQVTAGSGRQAPSLEGFRPRLPGVEMQKEGGSGFAL